MCGIWAVFGLDTNLWRHCGTTFTKITHRGPDAWRVEYDARVKVSLKIYRVDEWVHLKKQCCINFIAKNINFN